MSTSAPLSGRRVLVTRARDRAAELTALLRQAGATVVEVPLIEVGVLAAPEEIAAAVDRLVARSTGRAWLVLHSVTAVDLVLAAVATGVLGGLEIAVVGDTTAAALRAAGLAPVVVAPGQDAASLGGALLDAGAARDAALAVTAAGGRDAAINALREAGAAVEVLVAYRSVPPAGAAPALRAALAAGCDVVTFTSGSAVRHCAAALDGSAPAGVVAVCIGEPTATEARAHGWASVVTAPAPSAAGVVNAVIDVVGAAQPLP